MTKTRKSKQERIFEAAAAIDAHRATKCPDCIRAVQSVEAPACPINVRLFREWRETDRA